MSHSDQSFQQPPAQQFPSEQPGGFYMTQSAQQVEAEKAAQMSLILGILGLFFFGLVLGPIAIIQANKAEKLGKAATAGKVLGWIDTIWGLLAIVIFFLMMGSILAMSGY
ncbi:hypothetical protein E7744_07480 [Citricoccus sp. SGAir0253]|uniref:DUF4190 domain-containing protein n=1 Tax=Citricoccus sp. SGAir0253 TaxID=2567881 RepID=UPI0010CD6BD3|nr:DUF4190 domain-containing protein [Citricoccus sp. SGAir0253]QCU78044.1 hypothetical protein E7744_07480 [Citricoccus sp. SGAir0253]